MPDNYEGQYSFLSPVNPDDADNDYDGDGFTNKEEYEAGTNPDDINDNPGKFTYSSAAYPVTEGDGTLNIPVARNGGNTGAVSVYCSTTNGTAISGSDYTSYADTLNWANGDGSAKNCTVPILDDTDSEDDETFQVDLSNPSNGAKLGAIDSATVTITDNDATVKDDFGGDRKADILIRNTSGFLYLYEMDGNVRTGSNIGVLSTDWSVAGVGDFGGDGKADILVRNTSGFLYLYEMDGNVRTGSNIGVLSTDWTVERVADYGGDGKADILVRHTSGHLYLYEMDGNVRTGSNIGVLSTDWAVEVQ